ncbi:sel1 repeat family protein [Xanthomonas sp. XNM01]|uniref:sel1 repeat family protein n=1 Tax=Xanthomonas sp. XNM01 TaxID=2769289 RepID=UPI0017840884|nr:sel1 repeat family protein [Xanthomonas sp. XNM01]MBD9368760.1 sel1 repeat family protein [Xanthomonas sp. XNM01]
MISKQGRSTGWVLLAALSMPVAFAANPAPPDPTQDPAIMSAGFLSSHPDMRFRMVGWDALKSGKHEDAMAFFKRAAWYSDKPSQGMVAEMLWGGQGVPQDRPAAYAWMDLAAERGYEGFLILRERYWEGLDDNERARAIEIGQEIYARYGDAAAEPRLAALLRRERKKQVGSRTGFTGSVQIIAPGPGGTTQQIDGTKFYDERYWDPVQYRAWNDSIWAKPRVGRVDVGELEIMNSRVPQTKPAIDAPEPETPPT